MSSPQQPRRKTLGVRRKHSSTLLPTASSPPSSSLHSHRSFPITASAASSPVSPTVRAARHSTVAASTPRSLLPRLSLSAMDDSSSSCNGHSVSAAVSPSSSLSSSAADALTAITTSLQSVRDAAEQAASIQPAITTVTPAAAAAAAAASRSPRAPSSSLSSSSSSSSHLPAVQRRGPGRPRQLPSAPRKRRRPRDSDDSPVDPAEEKEWDDTLESIMDGNTDQQRQQQEEQEQDLDEELEEKEDAGREDRGSRRKSPPAASNGHITAAATRQSGRSSRSFPDSSPLPPHARPDRSRSRQQPVSPLTSSLAAASDQSADAEQKQQQHRLSAQLAAAQRQRSRSEDDGGGESEDDDGDETDSVQDNSSVGEREERKDAGDEEAVNSEGQADTAAAADAAEKQQSAATAERLRFLNAGLADLRAAEQRSGRKITIKAKRGRLRVNSELVLPLVLEWDANGQVSAAAWTAMKADLGRRKEGWRKRRLEREGRAQSDSDGKERRKKKKKKKENKEKKSSSSSGSRQQGSKKPSSSSSGGGNKNKKRRMDEGDKSVRLVGSKKKKGRQQAGAGDDDDFVDGLLNSEAMQQRKRSLRHTKRVDYAGQLEEDPLTIVDLTWYPSKQSQPFRVHVDPIVPVILDIHSHLADSEVIGVLAGDWDASSSLLRLQSAFPCRSLHTDNDLVNVEMDPASLVATSSLIAERGQRVVGWYHSHPYFRNQPSIVDVENQRKYQEMFREAGGRRGGAAGGAAGAEERHHAGGFPFIGGIVTPYGKGEFRPLPSNVKWFFNKEGRNSRSSGGGGALGSGGEKAEDEPMELWTDVAEEEKAESEEAFDAVLQRMLELCREYAAFGSRVDFTEEWSVNADSSDGLPALVRSGSSDSSPSSQSSPSSRSASSASLAGIRCKLDQFRYSLTQHLQLVERWSDGLRRKMVDDVMQAVDQWRPSGEGGGAAAQPSSSKQPAARKSKPPPAARRDSTDDEDEDEDEDDEDAELRFGSESQESEGD